MNECVSLLQNDSLLLTILDNILAIMFQETISLLCQGRGKCSVKDYMETTVQQEFCFSSTPQYGIHQCPPFSRAEIKLPAPQPDLK